MLKRSSVERKDNVVDQLYTNWKDQNEKNKLLTKYRSSQGSPRNSGEGTILNGSDDGQPRRDG